MSAFTLTQYQALSDVETRFSYYSVENNKNEWDYVWGKITSLRQEARSTTNMIANNIKEEILFAYKGNPKQLREDLSDYNKTNHKIINIFAKNTLGVYFNNVEKDSDDLWIGTRTEIVSDFSIDCSSDGRTRTYETEVEKHYNKELAKRAIEKILYLDDGLIGWQFKKPAKDYLTFNEFTEENLKKIYEKHGLGGLDSFEFLTASYIDSRKDLNGEYLVDERGALQKNGQIIVVQGFNINNQSKKDLVFSIKLEDFEKHRKILIEKYNNEKMFATLQLIVTFFMTILVFIIGSILLDREYAKSKLEGNIEDGECKE